MVGTSFVAVVVPSGAVDELFVAVIFVLLFHGLVAKACDCKTKLLPVPFNTSVCAVKVVNVPVFGVVAPMVVPLIVPPVIATALAF